MRSSERHLLQDHPQQSPKATAYLARIEQGELQVRTSDLVIFEAVFTLQRGYRQPKVDIRAALLPLIELPGISLPGKRRFRKVFDLYVDLNLRPKGQVTIPVEIRQLLGVKPKDKAAFTVENGQVQITPARSTLESIRGSVQPATRTEDFDRLIQEAKEEHAAETVAKLTKR